MFLTAGALAFSMNFIPSQTTHGQSSTQPKWVIAIHGGAGSSPANWTDKKRAARKLGLKTALEAGQGVLSKGGEALDAVEAVIRSLENDASFNAGRGAVLTSEGNAELDASIMDGRNRQCGAVAGATTVKNPITLARRVMTHTKHVLLAGKGVDQFALSEKMELVPPTYFLSYKPTKADPITGDPAEDKANWHYGTVGCVALDSKGHLAAGTSTGGTSKKLPGRVGDSPIVGAGTFADDQSCAVSGTGIGEQYIRHAVAYDIAAQMIYAGRSLETAVTEIMNQRLNPGDGGIISVSKDGEVVMQHNTPGMSCGVADSTGRFETHLELTGETDPVDSPSPDNAEIGTIRKLILQQSADWNSGDLDAFMSVYWKSEQLTFSSGGHTTRGWNATVDRYRTRYPDKATMGKVEFSELEFMQLDAGAYQVLGTWDLVREVNPIGGRFTLIFKRVDGQWRIVHDHTSARTVE